MFANNLIALFVTLAIAFIWLRLNDYFANKGWISSPISRKIIHIGTGPIFVLCWIFFKDSSISPYLAAIVPLGITIQFALIGLGVIKDQASVDAMSRSGDHREILRGPLLYGIAFVILTILFWRRTPTGVVALMILCGGDGMADIIGKRIKSPPLPWSRRKTLAGSLTMLLGGFIFAVFLVWIFIAKGYFPGEIGNYLFPIAMIALVTTFVESLPFSDIDNFSVPLVAVLMGLFIF